MDTPTVTPVALLTASTPTTTPEPTPTATPSITPMPTPAPTLLSGVALARVVSPTPIVTPNPAHAPEAVIVTVAGESEGVDVINNAIRPLLRLRDAVVVDIDLREIAPRIRGTLEAVDVATRERRTLVLVIALAGLGSTAIFLYLLWRRR